MHYDYVMQVGLTINDPKRGHMLIGANPEITIDNTSELNLVDKSIIVKTASEEWGSTLYIKC
ncbi:hypothetical protein D3C74_82220 [compost metagenome]